MTSEASSRYSGVMRWKISFFLLIILLAILLGIVYWLTPKGYLKAIMLAPQTINIQLSGMLEQQDSNRWTLVKDNRKITITNDSQYSPKYLRRPRADSQLEILSSSQVTTGTAVTLSLIIDVDSGKLTISNIIVD